MKAQRILALLCLILAFLPTVFFLPWLPVTIKIRFDIQRTLQYGGYTESYDAGQGALLHEDDVALILYVCGVCALAGLVCIAIGRMERPWSWIVWLMTCGTGGAIAVFWSPNVGPETRAYAWWMVIGFPISVAVVGLFGLIVSCVRGATWCWNAHLRA
jgi:hypothetical protein